MKISNETLNTITVFVVIFMIAISVIQRVEHQEKMKINNELVSLYKKNNELRVKETTQYELLINLLENNNEK